MKLALLFARRYIFSKKSTNAINIISGISVLGIALGSMALICILSVFNGFDLLLQDIISNFKPNVKITAKSGKVFIPDSNKLQQIQELEGVVHLSKTLEEIALIEYNNKQSLTRLKGVDSAFQLVTRLDTNIQRGQFKFYNKNTQQHLAVFGATLEYNLDIRIGMAKNSPITVYMPKRTAKKGFSPTKSPFKKQRIYPTGMYSVQEYDYDNYLLSSLVFTQQLLNYKKGEIEALELKLNPLVEEEETLEKIQQILGDEFLVQNRYQQDEAFFKITNIEKWVAFAIFAFTLILVAFNMVGALWMLVLEKKKDISTLKAMGATKQLIRNIFLLEGLILSFIGVVVGFTVATTLCILQQEFGLIQLNGGANLIVEAYPVKMRLSDFIKVFFTVIFIAGGAAWFPAKRAGNIRLLQREE